MRLLLLGFHFIIFIFIGQIAFAQKPGCTDRLANNYDSLAAINDGSCTYNPTHYSPPVKSRRINNVLNEASGLQMVEGFLWSFNDSGGEAAIYRIDTTSDALLQTIYLEKTTNVDWEDIAFDGINFYIGDFGNNLNGGRTDLSIYKFAINEILDYKTNPVVTIKREKIEVISFSYSSALPIVSTSTNNTRYDCEAMIVDNGKIHLFTKNWMDHNTTHYVINGTMAGAYIADSLETLESNYLITAADKAPGQDVIVLIGYIPKAPGKHYMHILSDYSGGAYFNGNKRKVLLPDALQMGQAEGIAFRNDGYGYIINEKLSAGPFSIHPKLRSFDISNFVKMIPFLSSNTLSR